MKCIALYIHTPHEPLRTKGSSGQSYPSQLTAISPNLYRLFMSVLHSHWKATLTSTNVQGKERWDDRCRVGLKSCLQTPFNNDVTHRKALESMSFVLSKFSQIANIGKERVIHHEVRLFPQCFFANGVIIKRIYSGYFSGLEIFFFISTSIVL